ncbi:MAG: hypothetical protein IKY96_07515 [Oscillospiraceae bacterium]|nr:hypothetical protein [Oscillospiraceae bacterium]
MKRQNQSMLEGPLFVNIILYTIPIILTSLLQLSAVSYAPAMNPVPPGIENQPPAYQQQFVNPYADYWAQMQQTGGAPPAIQRDVNAFPNHFQNGNQFHQPAGRITQPGFIPNALQTLTPYTSQKTAKKKGVKASAYDIMRDFSTNIPMFTHKQEVFIYNEESGAYERRTQNEVERIIMARYDGIISIKIKISVMRTSTL